mmetsp:Transcript_13856/g.29550  ORF Transcript_13856/g.29550 Transcript_13856/m.29550 type:complete len:103 (-) Transcript_13856:43-351(-)
MFELGESGACRGSDVGDACCSGFDAIEPVDLKLQLRSGAILRIVVCFLSSNCQFDSEVKQLSIVIVGTDENQRSCCVVERSLGKRRSKNCVQEAVLDFSSIR